jgi:hypothetical protein
MAALSSPIKRISGPCFYVLYDLSRFGRGIKQYHDSNMLEKARARQNMVAVMVSTLLLILEYPAWCCW